MSLICGCPVGSEITDITVSTCPVDVGQIQKIIFQRIYSSGTTKNSFTIASANPNLEATWTAVLTASDGTKAVVSPYVSNPETEPGARREYGGGNQTLGGIPINLGRESTSFTAEVLRSGQQAIKEMKDLECEEIGVYLINDSGQIIGISDDISSPTISYPIPIKSFFVSDLDIGGFEEPDKNMLNWSFVPNWSDDLYIITPSDFNALTDLG